LPIAFEWNAGKSAGKECEVVERRKRPLPQGPEAADPVAAELCLGLDVLDDLGRVDAARASYRASFHTSKSFLSKFQSLRPETIFLKPPGTGRPNWPSVRDKAASSDAVAACTTASLPSSATRPAT